MKSARLFLFGACAGLNVYFMHTATTYGLLAFAVLGLALNVAFIARDLGHHDFQ